jgi:hypothetical protein
MLLNLTVKGKSVRLELEAKHKQTSTQSLSVLLALKEK